MTCVPTGKSFLLNELYVLSNPTIFEVHSYSKIEPSVTPCPANMTTVPSVVGLGLILSITAIGGIGSGVE